MRYNHETRRSERWLFYHWKRSEEYIQILAADVKVIEQNYAFQSVAQSLLESVRDRDALITQLRFDNAALSRKISELNHSSASHHP
jgi:hypothetical protein